MTRHFVFIFLLFLLCAPTLNHAQTSRISIDYKIVPEYYLHGSGQMLPLDSVSVVANLSLLDIARVERRTGKILSLLDKEALLQKMMLELSK